MAYLSLYRKYRSQTFADVVEQEFVVRTLQNSIRYDRMAHAYIFSGPRGTGKTSLARIMAKAVNCLNLDKSRAEPCNTCENCLAITAGDHMDVLEIDAASNTGVDHVRDLIERVNFMPGLAKYKIYIVDEAHMLSTQAFNALLKTLEEPPAHVIFILATTDPQKIPVTIQSRCQRLDFSKLSQGMIAEHLRRILSNEKIAVTDEALKAIARYSGGHMRDALSLADQVMAFSQDKIDVAQVVSVVGSLPLEQLIHLVTAVQQNQLATYFQQVEALFLKGLDPVRFLTDLVEIFRDVLMIKLKLRELVWLSPEQLGELQPIEPMYTQDQIHSIIRDLSLAIPDVRYMEDPRVYCEMLVYETLTPKSDEVIPEKTPSPVQVMPKVQSPSPVLTQTSPTPPKSHLPDDLDLVTVKHCWADMIALLKKNKQIRVAGLLMESSPLRVQGQTIVAGFKQSYRFHYEQVIEEKNLKAVNEVAQKVFRRPMSISFILMDNEGLPADIGKDIFSEPKLIEDADIPAHIRSIAEQFEGEIIR